MGNSASCLLNMQLVNRQIINNYRIIADFMQVGTFSLPELQQLKSVFLNIYNCAWKPGYLKSSHIYVYAHFTYLFRLTKAEKLPFLASHRGGQTLEVVHYQSKDCHWQHVHAELSRVSYSLQYCCYLKAGVLLTEQLQYPLDVNIQQITVCMCMQLASHVAIYVLTKT